MARILRFTISGLMGVVLVAAIGLAALRSGSYAWAGAMFLLACGILALATVGAVCAKPSGRAWWFGFALFGWGYLTLVFQHFYVEYPQVPTDAWLRRAMPYIGPGNGWRPGFHGLGDDCYRQTGHCLLSLVAATLGGAMAHAFFGAASVRSDQPSVPLRLAAPAIARRWRRSALIGLVALVFFATVALIGAGRAPGPSAGVTVLLTWACLGLAGVAAVCGQGRKRAGYLGATVFGVGYMFLAFIPSTVPETWPRIATNGLLNALRPWLPPVAEEFPAASDSIASANGRILKALDQTVPMRFPQETPLEEVPCRDRGGDADHRWARNRDLRRSHRPSRGGKDHEVAGDSRHAWGATENDVEAPADASRDALQSQGWSH